MRPRLETILNLEAHARDGIERAIANHERFALQLSGGKDSLACLTLLKPWWHKLVVLWANPGDPFPETVALMERIKPDVAEFHEIYGRSLDSASRAFPVDTLPLRATYVGRSVEPDGSRITLQSRWECCWNNFWAPLSNAVKALEITLLFRGQRDSEQLRAPLNESSRDPSGASIYMPIKNWSAENVLSYLKAKQVPLPRFYEYMSASPDCMHCTAYSDDQRGRYGYLKAHHPAVASEYARRIGLIAAELRNGVEEMQRNLAEISA